MHVIDASSSAALYGKGVFTTIAIRDGEPFLWDKHWRRLNDNAAKLSVDLSEHAEDSILASLKQATERMSGGRARITVFDESPSSIWSSDAPGKTNTQIIVGEQRELPKQFRLTASPYPINSSSPLAGIKSCNYLEPVMSHEEARSRGCDEAVRLNERGHVASACMANIFWSRKGKLYTPSLAAGCLPGTTREYVLDNIETEEIEVGIAELEKADQIFLTSAGLGIIAVSEFAGRKLEDEDHKILNLL